MILRFYEYQKHKKNKQDKIYVCLLGIKMELFNSRESHFL